MRGAAAGVTHLALYARPPVPGRVKTRLASALGDAEVVRLYEAFVDDLVTRVMRLPGIAPHLWLSEVAPRAFSIRMPLPVEVQGSGDLGQRMMDTVVRGGGPVVILGTDAPTLPEALIMAAARGLEDADIVLGPSADGGYYAFGCRSPVPALFDGVRWSTPSAFADTAERARALGLRLRVLSPWYDVDTGEDLAVLKAHLASDPLAAPATARVLFST